MTGADLVSALVFCSNQDRRYPVKMFPPASLLMDLGCHWEIVMKTALKISLILNLGLLVSLVLVFGGANRQGGQSPATISSGTKPEAPRLPPAVSKPANYDPAQPLPFHWNQLYSNDYHIYVKSLRAIGCPEPTVRAIVTADVNSVFAIIDSQLEQQLSGIESGSWSNQLSGFNSEAALKAALQKIPDEETAKIADLLGLKPVQMQVESSAPAAPLPMPLVMQNVDLSALNLNADQKQVIAGLRQDFLKQIGGTNHDPDDLAYQARWQKAQPDADNMLEAMMGNDIYTKYQLAAHQQMLESLLTPAR
jgi:hypothetical protein